MHIAPNFIKIIDSFNDKSRHFFCEKMTELIYTRHLVNGDCVIDCGANHGLHTRQLSSIVGPSGLVHAFEPNPELFLNLMKINPNVRLWPFAVGEGLAIGRLHVPLGLDGWASLHDIRPILKERQFKMFSTLQVNLDSLDELHERPIRFVKIDVERHELSALKGMLRIIRKFKPIIIFEGCSHDIVSFLGEVQYQVINLLGSGAFDEPPYLPNAIAVHGEEISYFQDRVRPSINEMESLAEAALGMS